MVVKKKLDVSDWTPSHSNTISFEGKRKPRDGFEFMKDLDTNVPIGTFLTEAETTAMAAPRYTCDP